MEAYSQRKIVSYYQDILIAIFVFMLRDKDRRYDIRSLVERQLAEAQLIARQQRPKRDSHPSILGAVLHEWHRNARYVDRDFAPRPVRLHGPWPSVAALVRTQGGSSEADKVADEMLRLRLIKKVSPGRYLPVSRVATIRKLTPAVIDHVARSLERLLSTVNSNTRGDLQSESLIERTAFVHDLPRDELKSFRDFAQSQGSAFLANADEWLESRRAPKRSKLHSSLVRAGVHVYAFAEQNARNRKR